MTVTVNGNTRIILLLSLLMLLSSLLHASADTVPFDEWLSLLKKEAREQGISEATLDRALAGVTPIERVVKLDRNQAEFKKSFKSYMNMMVNRRRISEGRAMLKEHGEILERIEARYGVQPRFLVAIWGLETNFGSNLGGFPVIRALATLAYDGRRSAFFRTELFHALRIIDEGHVDVDAMQGSWAGAMGQLQFMPSTFTRFAIDDNNDGRKDIWTSLPDVFASAANFLSGHKWRGDMTWGRQVRLPKGFSKELVGMKLKKAISEWQKLGVRKTNGADLPVFAAEASVVQPSGENGPAFLVYQNYRAIMRWNRSHLYALAVCHLADRIGGS
jgi:membrane-bound lytic murein transglycosylase B